MWSMRDSSWMQGNLTFVHMAAAHKIPSHIIEYLIRIHIAMIIGSRNGLRVIIIQSRAKTTQHESIGFKGLMHWRWLVYPSGNGFKIMNRESPWEVITIPTDKVKGMTPINIRIDEPFLFNTHLEISECIVGFQILGQFHIPLAEWCVLHQLTKLISVALGCTNRREGLYDE